MARDEGETTDHPSSDAPTRSWRERRTLAWLIRAGLLVVPLIGSWVGVRLAVQLVPRPVSQPRTFVWMAGAIALSILIYQLLRRVLQQFSSLGLLFSLSLTFPDTAPSRLGAALRAGRVDDLRARLGGAPHTAPDPAAQARRMADLVMLVARREVRTRGHSDRVRAYAAMIGKELDLSEADLHRLQWATLLHDVGLLHVATDVRDKRGPLTDEDRAALEQHPVDARVYLEPFADWLGPWRLAAMEHHERWDGTGYPCGLAGEDISLAGRIVAVADAYDAMTSTRSYQKPRSPSAARQELVDNAGTQFDPAIVRAFLNVGIKRSRAGLGPVAALLEIPRQVTSLAPGVTAGAGVAAAVATAVVASTVGVPPVSSAVVIAPAGIQRVVDEPATTSPPTTSPPTTSPPTTTVTTTSPPTTSPPVTSPPIATTTSPPVTSPPTTSPPVTNPPTTSPPTTTVTPTPTYPTTPPPTTTQPYPTTGP